MKYATRLDAFKIIPNGGADVTVARAETNALQIMALWILPLEPIPTEVGKHNVGFLELHDVGANRFVCSLDVEVAMWFGRRFFNGDSPLAAATTTADNLIEEYQQKLATLQAHAIALDALAEGNLAVVKELQPQLADPALKTWTTSFLLRLQHASPLLHPIELLPNNICTARWRTTRSNLPALTLAVLSEVLW